MRARDDGFVLVCLVQVRQTEADAEGHPQLSIRGLHEPHVRILHHRPQTPGGQKPNSSHPAAVALRFQHERILYDIWDRLHYKHSYLSFI